MFYSLHIVLSVDNAKTVGYLNELKVYNVLIENEKCVNHICKRMSAALQSCAKQHKTFRARGKLTKVRRKMWRSYLQECPHSIWYCGGDAEGDICGLNTLLQNRCSPLHQCMQALGYTTKMWLVTPVLLLLPLVHRLSNESVLIRCMNNKICYYDQFEIIV